LYNPLFHNPVFFCHFFLHLFNVRGGFAWHQLSCTTHKQSLISRVVFPLILTCMYSSLFNMDMDCIHRHYHVLLCQYL
jgi:hypothetical protein